MTPRCIHAPEHRLVLRERMETRRTPHDGKNTRHKGTRTHHIRREAGSEEPIREIFFMEAIGHGIRNLCAIRGPPNCQLFRLGGVHATTLQARLVTSREHARTEKRLATRDQRRDEIRPGWRKKQCKTLRSSCGRTDLSISATV